MHSARYITVVAVVVAVGVRLARVRVAGSQFLTVESWLPLVSFLPSELKHTDLTTAECPLRGDPKGAPVAASSSLHHKEHRRQLR